MSKEQDFSRIRISSLSPKKATTFDVYVYLAGHHTLYLHAGDTIQEDRRDALIKKDGGDNFYVRESEKSAYMNYVHEQMNSASLTVREKASLLRDTSLTLVEDIYEQKNVHKALDASKPIINNFVNFMDAEPEAMGELIGLSGHHFYTFNHSLDVSIYSLGLGQAMGFSKQELEDQGQGALLHDIGKRNISVAILGKSDPLTDAEWSQLQKHPIFGLAILEQNPLVSDNVKACCFEHHESFLGNGYPQQLSGQDIHPMARIVAITDTFDAMTTQRSYNVPLKPVEALNMIKEKLHGRFDPEMVKGMYEVLFRMDSALKAEN